MRKLFEDMRTRLENFIEQRDHLLFVVRAGASEYVAVLKTLEGIDQSATPNVFTIFVQPFENPKQYVDAIIHEFRSRHQALSATLFASGAPPVAQLPDTINEEHLPVERLRAVLTFARSLIPDLAVARLVVGFLPVTIADERTYAALLGNLLERDYPVPWCHHMRFVVREDAAKPAQFSGPDAAALPGASHYAPDLSQAAIEASLADEAGEPSRSLADRMQALFLLASMDTAHQRIPEALEKFSLLARFYLGLSNLPMLALSLNGMGEACARADRLDEARGHFERALTPAIEARDLPSLINITFNLGRLHVTQTRWADALEYYSALSVLAHAALDASLRLICHEQMGECHRRLGAYDRALGEWQSGVTLAQGVQQSDRQLGLLEQMQELLVHLDRRTQQSEIAQQMQVLRERAASGLSCH